MSRYLTLDARQALLPGVSARRIVHEMSPWLVGELVATDEARERLRAWTAGGGLDRPAPDIDGAVVFHGDVEMLEAVVDAFKVMAPPARDYVLSRAAVLGTGWSTNGWTGSSRITLRPELIVLSGARRDRRAVEKTMLHEAAHVWLEPEPVGLAPAGANRRLEALAQSEGWHEDFQNLLQNKESRADGLAAVWSGERNR